MNKHLYNKIVSALSGKGLYSALNLKKRHKIEYQSRSAYRLLSQRLEGSEKNLSDDVELILNNIFAQYQSQANQWHEYFRLFADNIIRFNKNDYSTDQYGLLIDSTKNINYQNQSKQFLLILEYMAIANGMYYLGYKIRSLIIDKLLVESKQNHVTPKEKSAFILTLIEKEDFPQVRYELNRLPKRSINYKKYDKLKLHAAIMMGERDLALAMAPKYYSNEDKTFAEYIRGKRIAIVGPAPTDEASGGEIDGFDIVIRINYRGKSSLPSVSDFGSSTHISYYSNTNAKNIFENENVANLRDLDFIVLKSKYASIKGNNLNIRSRCMFMPNDYYITGKPQMIQNIIYDLLHFDPLEIKIFKSNFYMSHNRYYNNYYPDHRIYHGPAIWTDHAYHDLISQLAFTRTIMKHNPVTADQTTMTVLQTSYDDYIRIIQGIYSYPYIQQ